MSRARSDELPTSGRLLAVDLGEVRVGLAVSDPRQVIASPAETLAAPDHRDALAAAVVAAAQRHEVAGIVVGHPRRLDGREGAAARRARDVADAVRRRAGLPVALWDERFTTVEAERVMLAQDSSRRERRATLDRVAAGVILQGVLEAQRRRRDQGA